MNDDPRTDALPKLVGAPAYARPRRDLVIPASRPFDPDDLPLVAERTPDQGDPAMETAETEYAAGPAEPAPVAPREARASQDGRWFRIRLPGRSRDGATG